MHTNSNHCNITHGAITLHCDVAHVWRQFIVCDWSSCCEGLECPWKGCSYCIRTGVPVM
jgi:hypothetical protein